VSHIATIDVSIMDLDSLEKACANMGLVLVRGQVKYHCWGTGRTLDQLKKYQAMSGKALMPEGYSLEEMGRCDHVVRVPGKHGYEIGLVARKDGRVGWNLFCDLSGAHDIVEKCGKNLEKLRQNYAVEVAKRAAKRAGYRLVKTVFNTNGSISLVTQK